VTITRKRAEYNASKTIIYFAYEMKVQFGVNTILICGLWENTILSKHEINYLDNGAILFIDYFENQALKAIIKNK